MKSIGRKATHIFAKGILQNPFDGSVRPPGSAEIEIVMMEASQSKN
jgi:hypothetical protein